MYIFNLSHRLPVNLKISFEPTENRSVTELVDDITQYPYCFVYEMDSLELDDLSDFLRDVKRGGSSVTVSDPLGNLLDLQNITLDQACALARRLSRGQFCISWISGKKMRLLSFNISTDIRQISFSSFRIGN